MKQHWNGITNYIKTKINNGILEGTNSLIQAAKDSARGFRSTKNFIISMCLAHLNQHQQTQLVTSQVTSYREQIPSNFVY